MKNNKNLILIIICLLLTFTFVSDMVIQTDLAAFAETTSDDEKNEKSDEDSDEDEDKTKAKDDEDKNKDEEEDKDKDKNKKKKNDDDKDKSEDKKDKDEEKEKEYKIHAGHYLVTDLDYNNDLISKDSGRKISPSGLTKVLTAITVIENVKDIDKKVTVPKDILKDYDYKYSNVGLSSGEKRSYKDLISLMMMRDAGDCAVALSHLCCESYDKFIQKMNDTAKKAGATNSHFSNPAGFEEKATYSTLNDLAKIIKYAIKNETYCELASLSYFEMPSSKQPDKKLKYYNQNYYLSPFYSLAYYNEHIVDAKDYRIDENNTGMYAHYNNGAMNLLLLCAESDTDNESNYAYKDTSFLIEKVRNEFQTVSLLKKDEIITEVELKNGENADRVLLVTAETVKNRLKNDYDPSKITTEIDLNKGIKAPVKKDEILGSITALYNGDPIGKTDLKAFSSVDGSIMKYILHYFDKIVSSIWFKILFVIFLIYMILNIRHKNRIRKSAAKRPKLKTR